MRRVTSLVLVGSLILGSTMTSLAEENNFQEDLMPIPVLYTTNKIQDNHLIINEKDILLGSEKIYKLEDKTFMIPLRLVTEELGYEVKWNEEINAVELIKGPHWIMIKTDEDYYSFGKMAPVRLGTTAEIINGITYVPMNFFTDILRVDAKCDSTGTVKITDQTSKVVSSVICTAGKITEVIKSDTKTMVQIETMGNNEGYEGVLILNVNESTALIDPVTNEKLTIDDLRVGDTIRGYYGPAISASIPPQASAEKIEILRNAAVFTGNITEVRSGVKYKQVLIGDYMNGIILTITDQTRIVSDENTEFKFQDLKQGMEIEAFHDLVMTMSLPPITTAQKIVVKGVPSLGYNISKEVYKDDTTNTEINYPQIVEYPGELLESYMNQSLSKIINTYGNKDLYSDVKIDYVIKKMDEDVISILFTGSGEMRNIGNIKIHQSINIDLASSNEITYENYIKNNEVVRKILDEKAQLRGLEEGLEAEGIRIYFEGDNVVFYYMPLDDGAEEFIELRVPVEELIGYINTVFGEAPAS